MSDAEQPAHAEGSGAGEEPGASIFGNLPRSRPAVRSPRRADAKPPVTDPEAEARAAADTGASPGREAEVEALARAGISLAGEAATLGLRVAGRAAAALRDAVERR